jgi:hypothetical protein
MPTQRVLALVDRQAATRERLSGNLLALLARLWAALTTGQRYDDAQVAAFAAQAAALSKGARTAASGAQEAYLRQILVLLDTQPGRGLKVSIPDAPRGVDPVAQYTRPVEEFRRLRVSGLDELEANERALRRLQLIGDTDVSLAVRDTSAQVLASADKVTGWRRVVHPELSRGGSCGLCVVASDRLYHRGDLMPLHARCIPGDAVVAADGVLAITRRHYAGPLVVLTTASGQNLAVTPNHPVLTEHGWVPAGFIEAGDHVLRHRLGHGVAGRRPGEQKQPARVEDLWRAATMDHGLYARRVPLAPKDFHGDGGHGEVEVVATEGLLSDVGDVTFGHPGGELRLMAGHLAGVALPSQRQTFQPLLGLDGPAGSLVRSGGNGLAVLAGRADVALEARFGAVPGVHAGLLESAPDDAAVDAVLGSQSELGDALAVLLDDLLVRHPSPLTSRFDPASAEFTVKGRGPYASLGRSLVERLAGDVELHRVVHAGRVDFSDHVYNLQTLEGWYSADNYIVSNCNCAVVPIVQGKPDAGAQLNADSLKALYAAAGSTKAADLAKTRYVVQAHGELGPTLVAEGDHHRGPAEVRRDTSAA